MDRYSTFKLNLYCVFCCIKYSNSSIIINYIIFILLLPVVIFLWLFSLIFLMPLAMTWVFSPNVYLLCVCKVYTLLHVLYFYHRRKSCEGDADQTIPLAPKKQTAAFELENNVISISPLLTFLWISTYAFYSYPVYAYFFFKFTNRLYELRS